MPVCVLVRILHLSGSPFVINWYVLFCHFKLPRNRQPFQPIIQAFMDIWIIFPFQRQASFFFFPWNFPLKFSSLSLRRSYRIVITSRGSEVSEVFLKYSSLALMSWSIRHREFAHVTFNQKTSYDSIYVLFFLRGWPEEAPGALGFLFKCNNVQRRCSVIRLPLLYFQRRGCSGTPAVLTTEVTHSTEWITATENSASAVIKRLSSVGSHVTLDITGANVVLWQVMYVE